MRRPRPLRRLHASKRRRRLPRRRRRPRAAGGSGSSSNGLQHGHAMLDEALRPTARPRRRERHGPSRTAAARRMAHSKPPLQRMPTPQGYSTAASLRTSRAGRGGAEGVAAAAAATRTKAARLQLVLQLQYAISRSSSTTIPLKYASCQILKPSGQLCNVRDS